MRFFLFIVFAQIINTVNSQSLIDQFGYTSTFCSSNYYLYSDSSFVFERGCEKHSSITLGDYALIKDTLYLFPKRFEEINFIKRVEYLDLDTLRSIAVKYVANNDSTIEPRMIYTSKETSRNWVNYEISSSSLKNHESVKYNFEIYGYNWKMTDDFNFFLKTTRQTADTIEACPIELERLTKKRTSYLIPPEINEIRIWLELPYEVIINMINYETVYENLKPGIIQKYDRIIKIEYH